MTSSRLNKKNCFEGDLDTHHQLLREISRLVGLDSSTKCAFDKACGGDCRECWAVRVLYSRDNGAVGENTVKPP